MAVDRRSLRSLMTVVIPIRALLSIYGIKP